MHQLHQNFEKQKIYPLLLAAAWILIPAKWYHSSKVDITLDNITSQIALFCISLSKSSPSLALSKHWLEASFINAIYSKTTSVWIPSIPCAHTDTIAYHFKSVKLSMWISLNPHLHTAHKLHYSCLSPNRECCCRTQKLSNSNSNGKFSNLFST